MKNFLIKSLVVYKLSFILVSGKKNPQILVEKQAATLPVLYGNLFYSLTIKYIKYVFKIQNFEAHLLEGMRLLRKEPLVTIFIALKKYQICIVYMINRHNS